MAKNVRLNLHSSFSRLEVKMKTLLKRALRLQDQKKSMHLSDQLKSWEAVVVNSEDEMLLSKQIKIQKKSRPRTSKALSGSENVPKNS